MSHLPISDYGLLSDCRSAALVSSNGSVDWLCFPRFDNGSVFGRILDDNAGHWVIRPSGEFTTERRYLDDTMVLETTFRTDTGCVVLEDALAVGRNERGHELGQGATSAMLRKVTGVEGSVELELELAARPEYGLILPLVEEFDGGIRIRGGADRMRLSSPARVRVEIDDSTARARFRMDAGHVAGFALQHRTTSDERPRTWDQDEIVDRLDDTGEGWRTWSAMHQNYNGPWVDLVRQSGRVLYALTYWPTGAIVAAPTTSLPETSGGSRNWDYRYAWVRDASFTLQAAVGRGVPR
jgi:GH15 family glucan-1,4-alpha-glucosidase